MAGSGLLMQSPVHSLFITFDYVKIVRVLCFITRYKLKQTQDNNSTESDLATQLRGGRFSLYTTLLNLVIAYSLTVRLWAWKTTVIHSSLSMRLLCCKTIEMGAIVVKLVATDNATTHKLILNTMKYYKVIPYANGLKTGLRTNTKLIAGELYTESELKRLGVIEHTKNNYMVPVHINKNHTYIFFGARFTKQTT